MTLLDKLAHEPPFSLPKPRIAPTITRKIIPQIRAYSIDVAPRASRYSDVKKEITVLGTHRIPTIGVGSREAGLRID